MTDFGAMLLECHEGALNSGRDHFLHPFLLSGSVPTQTGL